MKNITSSQILLIIIATITFLLAAFSFYLMMDPSAPLLFLPSTPANTLVLPTSSPSSEAPTATQVPTRQTSYTPFSSSLTPATPVPSGVTSPQGTLTITPPGTTPLGSPSSTVTLQPGATYPNTPSPTVNAGTTSPTETLASGQYSVNGRILQNGTPLPNVVVKFQDDDPARQATTNSGGHYFFITLAPGTNFVLKFLQADNLQVTPAAEVASLASIEGTLPTGIDVITLPDLEVSLNLHDMIFDLQAPADGASYSAAAISPANPIQFVWAAYNQGVSYHVEVGPTGSEEPIFASGETTSTVLMWNGTLNNGTHITSGTYWWRVGVKTTPGDYTITVFTQPWDILFTP